MNNLFTIIKKPLFTEKGSNLKEAENKLLIEVSRDANKIEIKKAIGRNIQSKGRKGSYDKVSWKMEETGKVFG